MDIWDHNIARAHGGSIILGKAFAFVTPDAWKRREWAWIRRMAGLAPNESAIVSLLGPGPTPMPGVDVPPTALPRLELRSITTDKGLYREGADVVHLLVLYPLRPQSEVALKVKCNGVDVPGRTVVLNAQGCGTAVLRDLPAGSYEISFEHPSKDEPACSFTVAEYRLAPLVASLTERARVGDQLRVVLHLETFGVPVDGRVRIELHDRGRRVDSVTETAAAGQVTASLKLSGDGPHSLAVQLEKDPGRTASIPIVGSRAAERSPTVVSVLGTEVKASLLPGEGSVEVRGLYLEEGAAITSPLSLERVDTHQARLRVNAAIDHLKLVVVDPTLVRTRHHFTPEQHPERHDAAYTDAIKKLNDGDFAGARARVLEGKAREAEPHPYYAYTVACCHAREGHSDAALKWLRQAIADGWWEWDHMRSDSDLASLRELSEFRFLCSQGRMELTRRELKPGDAIDVPIPPPMGIIAVGAVIQGAPWEGWAAVLPPPRLQLELNVPEPREPGASLRVEVRTPTDGAAVYLIVKDARLLSPETPTSRLAAGMKRCLEGCQGVLGFGRPTDMLASRLTQPEMLYRSRAPMPPPTAMPMPRSPGMMAGLVASFSASVEPAPVASYEAPPPLEYEPVALVGMAPPAPKAEAPRPAPAPPKAVVTEEPEVLLAALLMVHEGRAHVDITLPDAYTTILIEAFALDGLDWTSREMRFDVARDPYVMLDVAPFVHPQDTAVGRVVAGARSGEMELTVTRDGQPVALESDGTFPLTPGLFEAEVHDKASGRQHRTARRVQAPGKLRRLCKSLRLLQPGETLEMAPDTVSLRVLPGLDKPFQSLLDATASYGHACCEQTAAKLLSACVMYALAPNDRQRSKAESIILAGVARERTMYLPGRGFKMYPESGASPDQYFGPKAARYLWNLDMLRSDRASAALQQAIDEGLRMAQDACQAYRLPFPPTTAQNAEEAYNVLRFGPQTAHANALQQVAGWAPTLVAGPDRRYGMVHFRSEAAFASASLLRANGTHRAVALRLANSVVGDLDEQGRLYSTVDSVAAIALMSELRAARVVVEGGGEVELNGQRMSSIQASSHMDVRTVKAVDSVVSVEMVRLVEEDWESYGAGITLKVALEKEGRVQRRLAVGDAVDLTIELVDGYKTGDVAWVCLPPSLSRIEGGGQVKRFSADFRGQSKLAIPLCSTGRTGVKGEESMQHFAVCVRNMFEEERAGSPGLLSVLVR